MLNAAQRATARSPRRTLGWTLLALGAGVAAWVCLEVAIGSEAEAHRDGCHSAHSCPSDASPPTYRCGDAGNECRFPNDPSDPGSPQLSGPPTADDCRNHPQYYTEETCAFAQQTTPAPTTAPTAAPVATPTPAATAAPTAAPTTAATASPQVLPNNGAFTAILGLSGVTFIEVGWGLLLLRRRRLGPPTTSFYWED